MDGEADDLPELVQNCNRVLFMHKGSMLGGMEGEALSTQRLTETLERRRTNEEAYGTFGAI